LKNKLAIYGAGGFGREVAAMIAQLNDFRRTWEVVGFFDDGKEKNSTVDGLKILGGINELNLVTFQLSVVVAVADPNTRSALIQTATNGKIDFPVLAHPNANLGDRTRNKFGRGAIVTAGVILTTGIEIGEFCIINLASTIGHDVRLGNFCTVMPACSISGNVSIGSRCLLGTGSRIIQGITIGENCLVGAGSIVTKSFDSNLKLLGVPARKLKQ
jgi:sugar O-acyltransferase (sialic acid O-acetyltransferase NeuD family)